MRLFVKLSLLSIVWIALAIYIINPVQALITVPFVAPILVIICLGILVFLSTYLVLRPYRQKIDDLIISLQESRFTPPKPVLLPSQPNELGDLIYQFNRFARELRVLEKTQLDREEDLNRQLTKSRSNMIKLTENLERVVAKRTAELRTKDQQLLQSGKLAGLGQLATGIAHEINQPLNIIKLIVTGMLRQYSKAHSLDTADVIKELNTLNQQTVRVQKIIEHMKAFARKRAHTTIGPIQINQPIKDALLLIGQQLKAHDIALELKLDPDIPEVEADPIHIEQILVNLVNNARDALDEKQLEPEQNSSGYKKEIYVQTGQQQGLVFFEVRDNGCGMTAEVQQQLFDPFFSTKGQKGTGLGMSITYNLIKNMNAEIDLESEPGRGSLFKIKFPNSNYPKSETI